MASVILLAVFTAYLARLPSDVPCRCFGSPAHAYRKSFGVVRNLALMAVATCGLAIDAAVGETTLDRSAVQAAVVVTMALVATSAHAQAFRLQRRVEQVTRL